MPAEEFATYEGRGFRLERGDRFRASGGPIYRTASGASVRMNEQGPFTFLRYCVNGPRSWIEAWGRHGHCVLELGPARPSTVVDGLVVKPYRIKPISSRRIDMAATKKKTAAPKATKANATPKAKTPTTPKEKPATKKAQADSGATPKRMSALDAAYAVLSAAGQPMTCPAMIEAMAAQGLWSSPGGKTPHATLYAAILREINSKGAEARFEKSDRGTFTAKA